MLLEPHYILVRLTNPHRIRAPTVASVSKAGYAGLGTMTCLNLSEPLEDFTTSYLLSSLVFSDDGFQSLVTCSRFCYKIREPL